MLFRNSRRSEFSPSAFGLAVLLSLSGCFSPRFSPPGVPQGMTQSQEICHEIMTQRTAPTSLRVLADATLKHGSDSASFRYAIVRQAPDSFRVDVLPPAGTFAYTIGLFVYHEGRAVWLDAVEKRYTEARGEEELFERFIGLPGITRQVVEGLLDGTVPQLRCPSMKVFEQPNGDILLVDPIAKLAWRVLKRTPRIQEVLVLDASGERIAVKGTIDYSDSGRPQRVTLEVFKPVEASGELTLTKVVKNPTLSSELFEVEPPANYERVE
jgi:hypothetical protein